MVQLASVTVRPIQALTLSMLRLEAAAIGQASRDSGCREATPLPERGVKRTSRDERSAVRHRRLEAELLLSKRITGVPTSHSRPQACWSPCGSGGREVRSVCWAERARVRLPPRLVRGWRRLHDGRAVERLPERVEALLAAFEADWRAETAGSGERHAAELERSAIFLQVERAPLIV